MCHKWPRISSVCRNHNRALSSFMTYNWLATMSSATSASSGAATAYLTFPEHMNSLLFFRSWCWSIFSFLCSVLWIFVCPFVNFYCVVCPSSTHGFWLLFLYLNFFHIDLHIYFILMKNSKVHKVWMLIIKKGTSYYQQVCTFCMNK
jgi:hypothetical protein